MDGEAPDFSAPSKTETVVCPPKRLHTADRQVHGIRELVQRGAMKAALLMGHGGPETLRYGEAPDPVAGPGEVVVDIYAASVNAADYKVRLGGYSKLTFPYILGRD